MVGAEGTSHRSGDGPELALRVPASFDELELIDRLLHIAAQWSPLNESEVAEVSLAVREAAANAVQHGSALAGREMVKLSIRVEGSDLVVVVSDQGAGFDPDELPDPLAPENLLRPSGRGIFLMRRFMDDVAFDFPEAGGTVVAMRKSPAVEPGQTAAI